ncbi:hypothetical protein BDQ12DRAFT_681511 [Crucibulum laeve]|uniref:Uncharacterized protein n=1 Tax=Crucibulum laeve TaxID=68775 RepID=A0A5C3M3E7_9AGAR|nr:hypothetical protein BDQ12DRAFT_681511 [Crucibulum laeve]
MQRVKQSLDTLRAQIDKSRTRAIEGEKRVETNKALLKEKDAEIERLQERLSLGRRLIILAKQWEAVQQKLKANEEKLRLTAEKADRLERKVQKIQADAERFENQYDESRKQYKALLEELDSLQL